MNANIFTLRLSKPSTHVSCTFHAALLAAAKIQTTIAYSRAAKMLEHKSRARNPTSLIISVLAMFFVLV